MPRRKKRRLWLVLNGKPAGRPTVRQAVQHLRDAGHRVEVRVTWEGGDAARYAAEGLARPDVDVIVAGGGDGTVNEVANGLLKGRRRPTKAMAVLPLGSANDFARGCGIAVSDPTAALRLAATGEITPIDAGRIGNRYFLNAAVGGFGAAVTFDTSDRAKKVMGGAAYGLTGFLKVFKQTAYVSEVRWDGGEDPNRRMLFAACCNGAQAGGHRLAPDAKLNDGLLRLLSVPDFRLSDMPKVVRDIQHLGKTEPRIVKYHPVKWLEVTAEQEIPLSPDGEIMRTNAFRIECRHGVLPPGAPLVDA